ncbi:hypothetical protein B296_00017810, partial [Ensete ventricosum]
PREGGSSRVSCSSSGFGGCHTRLKKGTQQGRLQFAGLWRLSHTAEPGGRKQGFGGYHTRLKKGKQEIDCRSVRNLRLRGGSKGSVEAESTKPGLVLV